MFVGIQSTISNTATGTVMADSGVSGFQALPPVTWLPNGLNLITSTIELAQPFPPAMRTSVGVPMRLDTTKHLTNPSTIKERRSYTRRR
jgi:hypothetical protein